MDQRLQTIRDLRKNVVTMHDISSLLGEKRWTANRKFILMKAVETGLLSQEEALERYHLGEEEFLRLQSQFKAHGKRGLQETKRTFIHVEPPEEFYGIRIFADRQLVFEALSDLHMTIFFRDEPMYFFTRKELAVLRYLIRKPGEVTSNEQLLDLIYEGVDEPDMKIIQVFICKIRRKLNSIESGLGEIIECIWGRGYMVKKNKDFILEAKKAA